MGAKVTTRCPKCGHVFEFLKPVRRVINMGCPYRICPVCKTFLLGNGNKEYIKYNTFDVYKWYESRIGLFAFVWAFAAAFLCTFIPGNILGLTAGSQEIKIAMPLTFLLVEAIPIYFLCKHFKPEFEQQKHASIERLKNVDYQKILISLKLITEQELNCFLNKYM